jgi:hypothetical protein
MRALTLGLLVLAGCGADPGLVGKWEYISADGSTALLLQFRDDGAYQADNLFATTQASLVNDERDSGTYAESGGSVTLTPTHSTCSNPPATFAWRRSGDSLALSVSAGEVILRPVPSGGGSTTGAAFALGCFVNGAWVPAQ